MKNIALLLLFLMGFASGVAAVSNQSQTADAQQLLQTAFDQYRAKKFDESEASCLQALKTNPNDFRFYALLGYIYAAETKMKSASESFAKALKLKPDSKELYMAKSQVDLLRNAHDEALAAAQQAVKVDPNYVDAHVMVGTLLRWDKGRQSEAITAYETAIRLNPHSWQAYEELGEIFEQQKDEKRAEEIFRKAMAADETGMAGRFNLGRMLVKQGRLNEARELWDHRVSDVDNTHPTFIELLTRAENLKKATEALAKNPDDPSALLDMGLVVMEGDSWVVDGRQKRAIEYFRKVLRLKPDDAHAQYAIVKAYIQLADVYKDENKNVDIELKKLREMDAKLADEMVEYRKSYHGGLIAPASSLDH
jgi:cytochrome c-type biogenesis protein CcmH/NrfG